MTTHHVQMTEASGDRRSRYGGTHVSVFVYRTSAGRGAPTRIQVWNNENRPNPRNGESVRYGEYGKLDGGIGRYLSPSNDATDDPTSVLISPESTVITDQRDGTGHPNSGQVWADQDEPIREGDTLALYYPNGHRWWLVRFSNNGHGDGVRTDEPITS